MRQFTSPVAESKDVFCQSKTAEVINSDDTSVNMAQLGLNSLSLKMHLLALAKLA